MKRAVIVVLLSAGVSLTPAMAMNNYDDPRVLISYMDKSLDPARDILRVATRVSSDNRLVFQVKIRGERREPHAGDYLLLQIDHGLVHEIVVPVDPVFGDAALVYERESHEMISPVTLGDGYFGDERKAGTFRTKRIPRGFEVSVPLDWIDYGVKLGYDAYTIHGEVADQSLRVERVYDHAGKAEPQARLFSPVTLLNNLCATRKLQRD